MTKDEMKQIIMEAVPFSKLKKNSGIYEFNMVGDKSLGISYEDLEDLEAAYVYNIFLGDQYANVSTRGTVDNPTPDELLEELVKEWNLYEDA